MLKIGKFEVVGLEHAIRGMRNPKNSWEKSDSGYCETHGPGKCTYCPHVNYCNASDVDFGTKYIIGPNDYKLMTTLRDAIRTQGDSEIAGALAQGMENATCAKMAHELKLTRAQLEQAEQFRFQQNARRLRQFSATQTPRAIEIAAAAIMAVLQTIAEAALRVWHAAVVYEGDTDEDR